MKNEFTLSEMTSISIPVTRKDPINSHQMPDFYYFSKKFLNSKRAQTHKAPDESPSEVKSVSSNHYIQNRFCAYEKAKVFNRPLFSQLSKRGEIEKRSTSNPRFYTSRFPNVPLTEELVKKVENINSFRDISKKPSRTASPVKPQSSYSRTRTAFRSNEIIENIRSWNKVKRETVIRNTRTESRRTRKKTTKKRNLNDIAAWDKAERNGVIENGDSFSSDFFDVQHYL